MSVQVSAWKAMSVRVECRHCGLFSRVLMPSAAIAISRAHVIRCPQHVVTVEECRSRSVSVAPEDAYEPDGVNPRVCRVWDARDAEGVR